jgi:hypothetical protein
MRPDAKRAFVPVPAFLMLGENTLSLRALPVGEKASFVVRLALFSDGDEFFTGTGVDLARIEQLQLQGSARFDRSFAHSFGVAEWSWSQCQVWPSAAAAMLDASSFIDELMNAFAGGDDEFLLRASEPLFRDMAIAFGNRSSEELVALARDQLQEAANKPAVSNLSAAPELNANGRLLRLTAGDGRDLLRKRDDEGPIYWPASIGKLNGKWQVFR